MLNNAIICIDCHLCFLLENLFLHKKKWLNIFLTWRVHKNDAMSNINEYITHLDNIWQYTIKVITKLPNSEESYKGKVKTHNYINRQNQSTTGKLWKP